MIAHAQPPLDFASTGVALTASEPSVIEASPGLFQSLLADEAILVLRRCAGRKFQLLGKAPAWVSLFAQGAIVSGNAFHPAEYFSFLDHFLDDAEVAWTSPAAPAVTSAIWTESLPNGGELSFTAKARKLGNFEILLIRSLGVDFEERRQLLQRAREMMLSHERLRKETSKKEALLHCLVHDVNGPLSTISNTLSLLEREPGLSANGHSLLSLAESESDRMQGMLKEVLDMFVAELAVLENFSSDPATAPDLLEAVSTVLKQLGPNMMLKNVTHSLLLAPQQRPSWKVAGHAEQLGRVVHNLLENALRHTPLDSTIVILLTDEAESIHFAVEDQGPGLEPPMAAFLFERLRQGVSGKAGKAGLGLFFCRMTIERWGGRIGHERAKNGGARFWFRLPKPEWLRPALSEKLSF